MDRRRAPLRRPSRSTSLPLLLALVATGCTSQSSQPTDPPATPPSSQPVEPTEPPIHGEPLPGSFYLTSDPPLAPYALSIRVDDIGGPSGRSAQVDAGDAIVVNWSTLPLPDEQWIEVNGQDCEGTFGIQARFETDLLLTLTDDACRVQLLGSHPEGGPHNQPGE